MQDNREQNTSYLAMLPFICIDFIASILFAYFKLRVLAILFMLLFLLGGIAFVWAKASIKNLYCDFNYSSTGVFPGETVNIRVDIRNEKFLPVLWMSIADGLTEMYTLPALLWHEDTTAERSWVADKRGIKHLEGKSILTGDGFGLRQNYLKENISGVNSIAVYPARVKVNPKMFMKNLWNANTGKNGTIEDVTVIKSTRDYQHSDQARYINWRLAARNLPLSVNVYDTIQPRGVHFIFDGESFTDHRDELEEALSILGSEIFELSNLGFAAGLSVCKGLENDGITYGPEEPLQDIMYLLAQYNPLPDEWETQDIKKVQDSVFDDAAVLAMQGSVGHFYYICYDNLSAARSSLLKMLNEESVTLLTYQEGGEQWLDSIALRTLRL